MTLAAIDVADYERKACPFCGGTKVRLHSYQSHGEQWVVLCINLQCGARGPRRYDGEQAMEAWNDRGRQD